MMIGKNENTVGRLARRDLSPLSSNGEDKVLSLTHASICFGDVWLTGTPMDDFIRTGGLNVGAQSKSSHRLTCPPSQFLFDYADKISVCIAARDQVVLVDAYTHLYQGTVYQHPAYLRPSLNTLIERHLKQAKKEFGFDDALLTEPPNLGGTSRAIAPTSQLFAGVPRPMTTEEAEAMVGDAGRAGSSNEGANRRIKGLGAIVGRGRDTR